MRLASILRCYLVLAVLPCLMACSSELNGYTYLTDGSPPTNPGAVPPGSDDYTDGGVSPDLPEPGEKLTPLSNYSASGKLGVKIDQKVGPGKAFTVFSPTPLGAGGFKHPIITWGNGTSGFPLAYKELLSHLASHGFVVVAANSGWVGSGKQLVTGISWMVKESSTSGSKYFGKLNTAAIGASGHSQGGSGAINAAAADSRIKCLAPLMPGVANASKVKVPMFVVTGSKDWVLPHSLIKSMTYNGAKAPICLGMRKGAGHFSACGSAPLIRGYVTAGFRLCLLGESSLMKLFVGPNCGICTDPNWTMECKNL